MITPVVGKSIQKANAAKIIALTNTLETASEMYYNDTGQYASENTSGNTVVANANADLSVDPGIANWDGPYLKRPLSVGDNPYKEMILLYATDFNTIAHTSVGGNGFDLDQDGTPETLGIGNCLAFGTTIPEVVARRINDAFDGPDSAAPDDWMGMGRVEYRVLISPKWGTSRHVTIYLAGGD